MSLLHEVNPRLKMAKIHLLFVGKLTNSVLLPAFSALARRILSHF